MQPLLNIAINAARQAGDIISRQVEQIEHIKVTPKGKHDFFCEVLDWSCDVHEICISRHQIAIRFLIGIESDCGCVWY